MQDLLSFGAERHSMLYLVWWEGWDDLAEDLSGVFRCLEQAGNVDGGRDAQGECVVAEFSQVE
ncbi:hypothetical protein SBI_03133 [Streptomyces bingchenggensis BCW-1]|uniref:Uncharacterized protein n=1 Tax=Streptomyces bingchenggensis (strain BCW-1) TaxID=749414 RepID=D7C6N7_STRBB|nr:hypothetical protein SBI_03133 [Streptomyces bingchenggensis BCW-1]